MTHLWKGWSRLRPEIERAGRLLLLFDYDGTLAPIVSRPEEAQILPECLDGLRRLATLRRCTLGFVSGRSLTDLQRRVPVPWSFYAANYGLEWDIPGEGPLRAPANGECREHLRGVRDVLRRRVGKVPGVLVEDKGLTLSLHYRLVARGALARVHAGVGRALAGVNASLAVHRGKSIYEIRPANAPDKGTVVRAVREHVRKRSGATPLTFYFGDDLGDEPAFEAVNGIGHAVQVGEPASDCRARFWVAGPHEVAEFIGRVRDCIAPAARTQTAAAERALAAASSA